MKSGPVIGLLLLVLAWPNTGQETYKSPQVASAGDTYVPYQVVLDGLFVLDVSIDAEGTIQGIDALRDPGSMLGAAKTSVRQWKFRPAWKFQKASREGTSAPSRMTVSFLYRPPNYGNAAAVPPKQFSSVVPTEHDNYAPVGVLSFAYPAYPVNSVAWGSVVVQLTVDSSGEVKGVDFLHGMDVFNSFVSDALKQWRFQAATFNGKPITSKTVIAFVFQPPVAK
jgi:Gram-negative bacterial TonB protein C-terminal